MKLIILGLLFMIGCSNLEPKRQFKNEDTPDPQCNTSFGSRPGYCNK